MLFSEEDAPLLKRWIITRLENTSDADADVLADYVIALLRHDGDVNTVRALCLTEIPDFLKGDTSVFVQDLFDAIQYKSYLPGARPPPKIQSIPFVPPSGPSAPSYGNLGVPGAPSGPQNGPRKRSYNERGDGDAQDRGAPYGDPNGRAFKQPRRGGMGRGGYEGFNAGRGGFQGRPSSVNMPPQGFPNMLGMPSPPPGMPPFDPNNPMAAFLAMQAMGLPIPGMSPVPQASSPANKGPSPGMPQKKQRCRDYDQKGFCARGNTCMFEHGQDSIYVPAGSNGEEYDPSNSSLMSGVESNSGPGNFSHRGNDRGRGRGGARGAYAPRGRGGRAEFSSDRPNFDKTKTTIVVEQIPEDKFSEEEVRGFFSEFGNIVEVNMRPYKRLAIVKYDDYESAKAAYNSPKVIFDNRFVKVYWFVDQNSLPKPPSLLTPKANGANGGAARQGSTQEESEPQIDIEEFKLKQQDVQKAHEEKQRKKQDMEAARKELEKRQEDLLKSQAEEKRKLLERIAAKQAKSSTPTAGSDGSTPAPTEKSNSQTEALKAQLAALEAEAKSLGIDPDAPDDTWSGRGRGRGRGGGYRGRGTFAPRGFRGGYRGRGAAPFARGGGQYNLDNRPKKIGLTGVDFSDPDKDESLRQFLLGIGEFTDLEVTPERTSITFKDRFTAEKFMYGLPGGEIPSVGKVDLAWIQTPLTPVNLVAKTIKVDDVTMDEGDAMAHTSSPGRAGNGQDEHENLDYDVADENDWGVQ